MAHHHRRPDARPHGSSAEMHLPNGPSHLDDEEPADCDEPPERRPSLTRSKSEAPSGSGEFSKKTPPKVDHKQSLLTQALGSSPELSATDPSQPASQTINLTRGMSTASNYSNISAPSTADLTSDGGFTSPARSSTPSPPLPPSAYAVPHEAVHKSLIHTQSIMASGGDITIPLMLPPPTASTPHESAVEAGLGRKRCITFACGRKAPPTSDIVTAPKKEEEKPASEQAKRPCALRFACPFKDAANDAIKDGGAKPVRQVSPAPTGLKHRPTTLTTRPHRDSESTIRNVSPVATRDMPESSRSQAVAVDPEPKVVRSQATRFHEFASSLEEEDEWMNQASVHQQRITVGDTLRKENAIRQLGEEAEEEALQDEEEEEEALDEDGEGQDGEGDVDDEDEEEISNDGNETDDEGGFADSDDESETGSDYNFWTPARSMAATAATSTDRLDPSYAVSRQTAPGSSIESIPEASPKTVAVMPSSRASRKASRPAKIRPGTPELPDSTDFVCGTLDEDRPLEVAYASCIEERRRSKHMTIPQDIDPSFPTSDTENDDDDDDDNDNRGRDHESHHWSDEHFFISGHLEDHVDDGVRVDGRGMAKRRSPSHSPKRARSPPPARHGQAMRSPPLKSGRMPGDRRSPPPGLAVKTPVPLRPLNLAALAPPLELTRTKSLPRTPNPFSHQHAATHLSTVTFPRPGQGLCRDLHSRGAIDIVKGLEKKRQRRKEKAWYKHCQQRAAKEKERKPQPGKGAERMRELGLEMAGKGGLHNGVRRAQYVLSI